MSTCRQAYTLSVRTGNPSVGVGRLAVKSNAKHHTHYQSTLQRRLRPSSPPSGSHTRSESPCQYRASPTGERPGRRSHQRHVLLPDDIVSLPVHHRVHRLNPELSSAQHMANAEQHDRKECYQDRDRRDDRLERTEAGHSDGMPQVSTGHRAGHA
eukprot:3808595-Rhodomonas_salina.1